MRLALLGAEHSKLPTLFGAPTMFALWLTLTVMLFFAIGLPFLMALDRSR